MSGSCGSKQNYRNEQRTLTNKILHNILATRRVPHEHDLLPGPQGAKVLDALRELSCVFLQRTRSPALVRARKQNLGNSPVWIQALSDGRWVSERIS